MHVSSWEHQKVFVQQMLRYVKAKWFTMKGLLGPYMVIEISFASTFHCVPHFVFPAPRKSLLLGSPHSSYLTFVKWHLVPWYLPLDKWVSELPSVKWELSEKSSMIPSSSHLHSLSFDLPFGPKWNCFPGMAHVSHSYQYSYQLNSDLSLSSPTRVDI